MILCKTILLMLTCGFLQPASHEDLDAKQLLDSAIVALGELNDKDYCARASGTLSSTTAKEKSPKTRTIFALSAKHNSLELHTWGSQNNLDSSAIAWFDALRDNATLRKRFKCYSMAAERHKDLDMETAEQLKENPQNVWPWPELNPFGLVFGSESTIAQRYSVFKRVRDQIVQFEYVGSTLLPNGNKVGTWISPNQKTRYTIEFNRNANNLPSEVKLELIENKQLLGLTEITWTKLGKNAYAPKDMSITSERDDGTTVQFEFQWEWLPSEEWTEWCEQGNFEMLFEPQTLDFRKPIDQLFEAQTK